MAQTVDERRENKRKWAADRRAAVRAERDARLRAARVDAVANGPRPMLAAVNASLSAAKWLRDSDGAAVNLARTLAEELDVAHHMHEDALALRVAGQLTGLLDRLGLTPVVRMKFELRSAQLAASTVTEGAEAATPAPAAPALPANVSALKRPAKRDGGNDRG